MQSLKGRVCSLVQSKSIGSGGAVLPFPNRKRYAEFSYKISRFQAGSDKISGFQIYGFHSDLRGISEKVYEISRSGGSLDVYTHVECEGWG